jgi:hypothetical protein
VEGVFYKIGAAVRYEMDAPDLKCAHEHRTPLSTRYVPETKSLGRAGKHRARARQGGRHGSRHGRELEERELANSREEKAVELPNWSTREIRNRRGRDGRRAHL